MLFYGNDLYFNHLKTLRKLQGYHPSVILEHEETSRACVDEQTFSHANDVCFPITVIITGKANDPASALQLVFAVYFAYAIQSTSIAYHFFRRLGNIWPFGGYPATQVYNDLVK